MVQEKELLADKGSPGSEELLSLIQSYIKWLNSVIIRRQWVMQCADRLQEYWRQWREHIRLKAWTEFGMENAHSVMRKTAAEYSDSKITSSDLKCTHFRSILLVQRLFRPK
jgi:hypothetical protein